MEHMKQATKSVGAFDDLQKAQAENLLFGNGQNDALHFDGNMTYFMEKRQNTYKNYRDYDDSIRQAYEGDMNNVDALYVDTLTRQLMYDPMTFILVPAGEKMWKMWTLPLYGRRSIPWPNERGAVQKTLSSG